MIDQKRMTGELLDSVVIDVPKGEVYDQGHVVPCAHILCCEYEHVTRWYDGRGWSETWKADEA